MTAISIRRLTRDFGRIRAVDNVSLDIGEGEIFGLLGPNGAGKTTLISMLVTLRKPTSGSAEVNGFSISGEQGSVRKSIGIVFQDPSLDEELTACENLELHAAMYGMPREKRKGKILEAIRMVELEGWLHRQVKTFSGGMRRRLEIARGLLHTPRVLFLDEPTLGLDPQTRGHIWDYIRKLRKEHRVTVVLTTHYMDEADSLCDRIAIIDHGKIIALGKNEELKDSLGGDIITLEASHPERLRKATGKLGWVKEAKAHNGKLTIRVEKGETRIPKLMDAARAAKSEIRSVSLHRPTLDDVFLHYTGRTIREENASALDSMRARRAARLRR